MFRSGAPLHSVAAAATAAVAVAGALPWCPHAVTAADWQQSGTGGYETPGGPAGGLHHYADDAIIAGC